MAHLVTGNGFVEIKHGGHAEGQCRQLGFGDGLVAGFLAVGQESLGLFRFFGKQFEVLVGKRDPALQLLVGRLATGRQAQAALQAGR